MFQCHAKVYRMERNLGDGQMRINLKRENLCLRDLPKNFDISRFLRTHVGIEHTDTFVQLFWCLVINHRFYGTSFSFVTQTNDWFPNQTPWKQLINMEIQFWVKYSLRQSQSCINSTKRLGILNACHLNRIVVQISFFRAKFLF